MLKICAPLAALILAIGCSQPPQSGSVSDTSASTHVAVASAQATPASVVDAFSAALHAGNTEAVALLMAPDVIIAESGEVERSFAEYAGHHLAADIAFAAAVTSSLDDRKVITGGDMATVVSRSEIRGSFRGRAIHSNSMETMVLRRTDDAWRIVHIHWSSAPITEAR